VTLAVGFDCDSGAGAAANEQEKTKAIVENHQKQAKKAKVYCFYLTLLPLLSSVPAPLSLLPSVQNGIGKSFHSRSETVASKCHVLMEDLYARAVVGTIRRPKSSVGSAIRESRRARA
jgi:hypothetical protein